MLFGERYPSPDLGRGLGASHGSAAVTRTNNADASKSTTLIPTPATVLSPADISEVIEMALSDHVSFDAIRKLHGLSPNAVKVLMRRELKPGSYRAWRRRVDRFGARREFYKQEDT